MNTMKYLIATAVVFLGAFSADGPCAKDPISKAIPLPFSLEQKVEAFQDALEADGYQVARGYWDLWTVEDCKFPLQTVGDCYGNNPTAPYVMAVLPHWDDEFVDQSLHHALIAGQRNMTPNYRLGEREALVVMAELPPPARYFGIQSNVFTREAGLNKIDSVYSILEQAPDLQAIVFRTSPNPDRMMMVASIGNSTNNVVIEEQSKENWGQQRFFVITPDKWMADAMTEALTKLEGVEATHVFTEPVSPFLVNVGYGPEADDLITYIRYSMPNDAALGEQWRKQLPLTILRVRDPGDDTAFEPFDIPEYEAKTANIDEVAVLGDDLKKLVEAVKEYWGQDAGSGQEAPSNDFRSLSLWIDLIGQHCLGYDGPPSPPSVIELPRGPMNCLGDGQDADYQISATTHRLDGGEVIAVVGTLGTKTGNATYSSLSVNWFPELVGLLNCDDTVLEESAKKFKDKLVNPYTKFYVYYFARDCSGLYPWCKEIPTTLVSRGETIKIIQRNYINPGSRRGADPKMILNPVSIEFDGEERPTM